MHGNFQQSYGKEVKRFGPGAERETVRGCLTTAPPEIGGCLTAQPARASEEERRSFCLPAASV